MLNQSTFLKLAIGTIACLAGLLLGSSASSGFDCANVACPKLKSCAEAYYKLVVCGQSVRDRDKDGIPCEDLCGSDQATYEARLKAQGVDLAAPQTPQGGPPATPTAKPGPDGLIGPSIATFACMGKHTCKEMLSCEEARYYLTVCNIKSLDKDGDGRPCNSLCR